MSDTPASVAGTMPIPDADMRDTDQRVGSFVFDLRYLI